MVTSEYKMIIKGLVKCFGDFIAVNGINLKIKEGQLVSILGPSGCGKTTLLRLIAGLEKPDSGEIIVDGRVLSSFHGVVPPEKRKMGMVFQSYAVWPHMTVFDNVAYGLKIKKYNRSEIKEKVANILNLVGIENLGSRYPTQLSGGQQQRVALCRSMVTEPSILLLDEPLSNLDAKLRELMRFEIRNLQKKLNITTVYVTHSREEALAISDFIAVIKNGNLLQYDTPQNTYHRPKTRFIADFIGLANLIRGNINGDGKEVKLQDGNRLRVKCPFKTKFDHSVSVLVRPEAIKLYGFKEADSGGESNQITGIVKQVSFIGNIVDYFVKIHATDEEIRVQSTPPSSFKEGDKVIIAFSEDETLVVEEDNI